MRALLQIGAHALDGPRPRVTPAAKIENETRVADSFAAEARWRRVILTQELLHFS
jgi:hypothetical protein